MNIAAHLEHHFGPIMKGWRDPKAGPVAVVSFSGESIGAHAIYSTLGLSNHILTTRVGKSIRQELLIVVGQADGYKSLASALMTIAEGALETHSALLRGEMLSLPSEVQERLGFAAFYCAIPVFEDDSFATCPDTQPRTVFVWLIPIKQSEAEFVRHNGWEAFEDALEVAEPDLFDTARQAIL